MKGLHICLLGLFLVSAVCVGGLPSGIPQGPDVPVMLIPGDGGDGGEGGGGGDITR